MSISIRSLDSKKDLKVFIDFPHELYADDPNYVPELYIGQKEIHNTKKNPYFENAKAEWFLAYRNDRVVGRIAAHIDHSYNEYHDSNVGMIGFFDFVDDQSVVKALLDKAEEWLKKQDVDAVLGPVSFKLSTDTGGLLIDGFDGPPQVMMTYNAPYYQAHIESCGYSKEMDLLAYMIYTSKASERSIKMEKLLSVRLERSDIFVRKINLKNFKKEVELIKIIYDKAWEKNWGFVPPSENEFAHLASFLKLLVDKDFAYIAMHKDKPVGFFLSLPNINEITKDFKKGRLFPFNIFKLLFNKKKVKSVRIITLGVIEEYRNKGIEAIFYAKNIVEAKKRNLIGGEASWILENNKDMVLGAEKLNGEKYRTYRIFKKALN